jgi:metal-responsive CopG/Arc/MetJ family transcriptional regulator
MKTVQVVLDEATLRAADRAARGAKVNRSRFIRMAIREYLRAAQLRAMERRQRAGYLAKPVRRDEFDPFEGALAWPEE